MGKLKVVSLFSGAGGLDLGFIQAGYQVVWANDFDKDACETYRANIGDHIHQGPIEDHFVGLPEKTDILIGGPPCQGFSVAGKMDPDDPRSKLVWDFCRAVEKMKPSAFVMENVKALATLSKWGPILNALIIRFRKLGYTVDYEVLNSKDFGVPQSRERVFFVGIRDANLRWDIKDISQFHSNPPSAKDVIASFGKAGSESHPLTCTAKITLTDKPVLRKSPYAGMLFNGLGRPIKLNGPCQTLPASMGGNKTPIIDDNELHYGSPPWIIEYHRGIMKGKIEPKYQTAPPFLRRMTIREAAAIQTFPSDYQWMGSKTSIYKQIGNAVPPKLGVAVASFVRSILDGKGRAAVQQRLPL